MRLFISIDFSDDVLDEIRSWIPDQKGWKKVSKHQMHLTLAFLGEYSAEEKEKIHTELSGIQFPPFSITIRGLGAFPNTFSPRIIWAGVSKNDTLMILQQEISDRLKKYIKSKGQHSYVPHITLARKKEKKGMNHLVKKNLQNEPTELNVYIDSFHLKQSILKPSGSEHRILHRYRA